MSEKELREYIRTHYPKENSHFSSRIPSCSLPRDSRRFSADNHAEIFCINTHLSVMLETSEHEKR